MGWGADLIRRLMLVRSFFLLLVSLFHEELGIPSTGVFGKAVLVVFYPR
jgi:hypothetical protein